MEPSCGSTIWCNDVYQRLAPDFRTTFLALPGSGAWQHSFEETIDLATAKQPYGPRFAQYAEELTEEVGRLLRQRRPDLVNAQHLGLALAFARAAGSTPLISIAHGADVIAAAVNEQARDALIEIVMASSAVAVPHAAMADQVNALTQGKFNDRLITVPWGIPVPDHPTVQPSNGRRLRLLHAGRLDANKSTVTAIEAMALTADEHHLTIIGSGSELPSLAARTGELGLTHRIRFEPFMPREELWQRFADFDAFLFTTKQLEAFGLVAVEAQAHGLPVVYGDLPGLRHTLGAGALAYPPGDAAALAECIDQLADDPELRRTLGTAAADSARRHDISTTTAHLRELSKTVMGAARV
ncbi:glycosyltransferase family 4 protein [Streptomyces sp. AK02-01A]|uniref:glycosyltransferase family 4 protein n=1 Tax=Streptomyces sp. AK02-01A TaxID=3028648 RepID=UPI0029A9B3E8|nr:glycosyltransferase family 4 protein [Streptomyces sp. AK02-01A]MDX3854292.1 glycosyltransferase family 4 protein [Streptomyces sp. AK02-01A]